MSYGTNVWVGVGRMTRDPESRYTRDNKMVVGFSIAVSRGKKPEDTLFMECSAWEKTAEVVAKYTQKGKQVCVTGALKLERWTGKDGVARSQIKCEVRSIELLADAKGSSPREPEQERVYDPEPPPQGPIDFEPLGDDETPF